MQLYEVFGAAKFRMRSANPLLQLKPTSTQPQNRRVVVVVQSIGEVLSVALAEQWWWAGTSTACLVTQLTKI